MVPREQVDECRRLSQTLRSENAQLKDQMLTLKGQNRDFAERAVDDSRRLSQLEEANNRLETSVQAYQDERTKLESAFKELRASLPGSPQSLSLRLRDVDQPKQDAKAKPDHETDPDLEKTQTTRTSPRGVARARSAKASHSRDAWAPAKFDGRSPSPPPSTDP
jgi:chromosome segregation ATPase